MRSLLIACTAFGLLAGGCGLTKKKDSSDSSDSGSGALAIVLSTEAPVILTEFSASVNKPDEVKSYLWSAVAEDGTELISSCSDASGATFSCNIDEPGKLTIQSKVTLKDGASQELSRSVDILDPSQVPTQKPKISLTILDSTGASIATVATMSREEDGATWFVEGKEFTFDFNNTQSTSGTAVTIEMQFGEGASWERVTGTSIKHTFAAAGIHVTTIRVTDDEGRETLKKFQAVVKCASTVTPLALVAPSTAVAKAGWPNFYNYSAAGAASGGGSASVSPAYKFMWDFNGDGIYDSGWLTTEAVPDPQYVLFSGKNAANFTNDAYRGIRNARLRVWETGCNEVKEIDLAGAADLEWPMSTAVAGELQKPHLANLGGALQFFQVKSNGAPFDNAENTASVNLMATYHPAAPLPRRLECSYHKANKSTSSTLTISALDKYTKYGRTTSAQHGAYFQIASILDGVAIDPQVEPNFAPYQVVVTSANSTLKPVKFYTDINEDSAGRRSYESKPSNCTYQVTIDVMPGGVGTCADQTAQAKIIALIDGTFSCSEMVHDGVKVAAQHGAFYCESAILTACPPGGGGGGGGIPPIPE